MIVGPHLIGGKPLVLFFGTDLFYLDRCNGVLYYHIDVFGVGYRRDLDGGNTCMGVGG